MAIPYTKMHGCRNDYIYVDNREGQHIELSQVDLGRLSQGLANRKTGLGSDGLIVLEKPESPTAHAKMRMFNSDGSEGKMCGNGIRCIAKLLHEKIGPQESFKIETASGLKECFVLDASDAKRFIVKVNMGRPSFLPKNVPVLFDDVMVMDEEFEVDGQTFRISCVSMGNPHCVISVTNLETFDVARFGPQIEKHEAFPEGVNVEFIELQGGKVFQRTWERGSGETMACGTGACAVGVVLIMGKKHKSPVEVQLKGGALSIAWDGLREVWMTGEAVTESAGTFEVSKFI